MARPETTKPIPENPQFALANELIAYQISTLELAAKAFEQTKAEALEREEELRKEAGQDPLTGLPNRAAFERTYESMRDSKHRRRSTDTKTAYESEHHLLMIDADDFKAINDKFGHVTGDETLRSIAGTMAATVRSRDLLARIGGEEFAALLPRTTAEEALLAAEKIRAAVAAKREEKGATTVSIGVARVDLDQSLEENTGRADDALYYAKEHGRNQVVQYEDLAKMQRNGGIPHSV